MGTAASSEASESGAQAATPPAPPRQPTQGAAASEPKRPSYWEQANAGYNELVNAIIRPPRAKYTARHLGPSEFSFASRRFRRRDFNLTNERGMKIVCSHWEPAAAERRAAQLPCVIYMHGNSSARVEVVPQLALCLSIGATCLAFDFAGSGQSDGPFVSLGFFEREDLKAVINHLRESGGVSTIALWGRSMGAATSLMHGDRDPSIAAMVLDSPFADLTQLAEEMVDKGREQGLTVPGFVVSIAISFIKGTVKSRAGFSLKDISPIKRVDMCFIPALFVAGKDDDFILPKHSEAIHARYAGDKNLVLVEGDHNSPRPRFLFDSAAIFLQNYLQIDPTRDALPGADPYNGGYPPWVSGGHYAMRAADFGDAGGGGGDDDDDDDAWPAGYGEDDDVVDASELHDGSHLGMTTERQHRTQQALLGMFGGGGGHGGGVGPDGEAVIDPSLPSWACGVCTLINHGGVRACTACGTAKE